MGPFLKLYSGLLFRIDSVGGARIATPVEIFSGDWIKQSIEQTALRQMQELEQLAEHIERAGATVAADGPPEISAADDAELAPPTYLGESSTATPERSAATIDACSLSEHL